MKEKNSELFVANHNATTEIVHLREEVKHYAKNVDESEGRYRQELNRRTGLEKNLKEEKEERAKEKEARAKEQEERAKEREVTEKERGRLLMEKDLADKDRGRLIMERDAIEKERVRLSMEREAADNERMRLLMERDALKREKEGLEIEKTTLMMEAEEDGRKWEEVVKELEQVRASVLFLILDLCEALYIIIIFLAKMAILLPNIISFLLRMPENCVDGVADFQAHGLYR